MEHQPNTVKPRDVEAFDPRDRRIALLIDEALAEYQQYKAVADLGMAALADPPEAS